MSEDMRGLFFIIKGRYTKNLEPEYTNAVSGDKGYLGGFNPHLFSTPEWYTVLDRKCYHTIYCGSSYTKAVASIGNTIRRFKGDAKKYFKEVSTLTSDDYYEVHYLGHTPLTPDKRAKKCEGRCPRTSPIMMDLYHNIDLAYGDYYYDEVVEQEDLAYEQLIDERPVNKSKRLFKKLTPSNTVGDKTPLKKVEKKSETPKLVIKPVKRNVKLIKVQ